MPVGPVWNVGAVRITSVIESDQHWKFAWLLPEVKPELLDAVPWLQPHFVDEAGKMVLRIQALVVESQGQTIVVDTCGGNNKPRTTPLFHNQQTDFLADFAAAGFDPEAIDAVVCTHLHMDHVGWNTTLIDGAWVPTFPQARHLFVQAEYEHWTTTDDADDFGDVMGDSVAPIVDAGLADLVSNNHAITDEVRLESTAGHTPGHCSVRISSQGKDAVITGDMVHHPIQLHDPTIGSSADIDSAAAIATRNSSFQRWHEAGALVIGTHFGGPGASVLEPRSDGSGWIPVDFL